MFLYCYYFEFIYCLIALPADIGNATGRIVKAHPETTKYPSDVLGHGEKTFLVLNLISNIDIWFHQFSYR